MYAVKPFQNMLPILVLLLVSLVPPAISAFDSLRMDLSHVDAGRNFTKFELLQRMAIRSRARAAMLATSKATGGSANSISTTDVPVFQPTGESIAEYTIGVSIGTPPQPLLLVLDTGSDLVWTQCQPCLSCINQSFPLYDPSQSATYSPLPCSSQLCQALLPQSACHAQCFYLYGYGDGSTTAGTVASEAFTFGSANKVIVPNLGFGCGFLNQGLYNGIAGFGRGPLSLISQLGVGKFGYCFTSYDDSKSSTLMLGSAADLNGSSTNVRSTPFVTNTSQPTYYYLSLDGITVGTTRLPIPRSAFALQQNGTGSGVIIDSGTSYTQLTSVAYKLVRSTFLSQVKLPVANGTAVGSDLCFSLPSSPSAKVEVPKLIFHFEGADMDLPRDNYMSQDSTAGLTCLVMLDSGSESSAIGNFQQQNMHIVYDLNDQKLSFAPAQCDQM